jgi:hypothetical protein
MQPFGCRYAAMGVRLWYHSPLVTWQTCGADSSATPTNAYSNYDWKLIPEATTGLIVMKRPLPVASDFGGISPAGCKIVDVRGRVLAVVNGSGSENIDRLKAAKGIYYVVDKNGGLVQKVLAR